MKELSNEGIEGSNMSRREQIRAVLNGLVLGFIILLLLALLWPVKKPANKVEQPWAPPRYSVVNAKSRLLSSSAASKLRLYRGPRGRYVVVAFELKNDEARIACLTYDKFQLIIRQNKGTRTIDAHHASELLGNSKESAWGRVLETGKTAKLEVLFNIPKEATVKGFRIYDADWRSNRYKDIPFTINR